MHDCTRVQLRHAWLHSCIYDTLYHPRRNDRDRECECDSEITINSAASLGRASLQAAGVYIPELQVADYVSHAQITHVATADNGLYVVLGAVDGSVVVLVIVDPQDSAPADHLLHALPSRDLHDDVDLSQSNSTQAVSGLFTAIASRRLHAVVRP